MLRLLAIQAFGSDNWWWINVNSNVAMSWNFPPFTFVRLHSLFLMSELPELNRILLWWRALHCYAGSNVVEVCKGLWRFFAMLLQPGHWPMKILVVQGQPANFRFAKFIIWKWCWTWNESEWAKYRKSFKRSELRKSSQKRRKWNEMKWIVIEHDWS